jgi:mono/diheme cytochrome c family protein
MKKALIVMLLAALVIAIATPAMAQTAADTYKAKCKMCHGEDGAAATPMGKNMKIPSFKDPTVVKMTDQQLNDIIANGKDKMPKYADKLKANEITDLVKYVRDLQKK